MDQETNNSQIENEQHSLKEDLKSEEGRIFAKTLGVGLLIFLGAYCAFYTVADWHMKHLMPPIGMMNPIKIDRMIQSDFRKMDKFLDYENSKISNVVHMEETDNGYKIMIDLKAFDNNPNNIQVKRDGNILTIRGRKISKHRHNQEVAEFQQSYMFDKNANLSEMTRDIKDKHMIINIPLERD